MSTEQTAHTPTDRSPLPWFIYPISDFITIQCGPHWVAELKAYRKDGKFVTVGDLKRANANAAFICEAVNSHALLVEQNERMRQALQELLRVDDDWHGSVNSEMANARAAARAALNPPPTK